MKKDDIKCKTVDGKLQCERIREDKTGNRTARMSMAVDSQCRPSVDSFEGDMDLQEGLFDTMSKKMQFNCEKK